MVESLPGLSVAVARDWLAHRKAKKSPLTPSAWQPICAEIGKAGVPPDEALSEAMAAGWTGFKASWLANREGGGTHGQRRQLAPDSSAPPGIDPETFATLSPAGKNTALAAQRWLDRKQREEAENATH